MPRADGCASASVREMIRPVTLPLRILRPLFVLTLAAVLSSAGEWPASDAGARPAPQTGRYVALGDSYSSGEGLAPFVRGTAGRGCHRSRRAFPQRFAAVDRAVRLQTFVACSGARTANVGQLDASGKLTGVPQTGKQVTRIQLTALTPRAWRDIDLVTVTIGGNDAGFSDGLRTCIVLSCETGNLRLQILALVDAARSKIGSTYAAIRRRAPQATIVVLGYPQLFAAAPYRSAGCPGTIPRSRQLFLRHAATRLERIIAQETRRVGVFFASVEHLFEGHEPCGQKADWLFGIQNGLVQASYHPNADGQRAYARRLRALLRCLTADTSHLHSNGLPANPPPGAVSPRCAP